MQAVGSEVGGANAGTVARAGMKQGRGTRCRASGAARTGGGKANARHGGVLLDLRS